MTCGWQRNEYGSCTRAQSRCEARIPLPASSRGIARATAICPGWPRTRECAHRTAHRCLQRIDRHGAGDEGRGEHVFGAEQARQGERGRHLRAVDEREAFLRSERAGLQGRPAPDLRSRASSLAADAHLADAEQRRTQMRERRQIAGGADRALRRDHGIDLVLQQRAQRADRAAGEMPE